MAGTMCLPGNGSTKKGGDGIKQSPMGKTGKIKGGKSMKGKR